PSLVSPRSNSTVNWSCTVSAPPEFYPLSLHDALPISHEYRPSCRAAALNLAPVLCPDQAPGGAVDRLLRPDRHGAGGARRARLRSEEHTSELQSRENLVCRLLLEKKKVL